MRGHLEVERDQVRRELGRHAQRPARHRPRYDDLDARIRTQQVADRTPIERRIVDHQDAKGLHAGLCRLSAEIGLR